MKWISAKERLPKNNGRFIVCSGGDVTTADYWAHDGSWWLSEEYMLTEKVTHWMPLPSRRRKGPSMQRAPSTRQKPEPPPRDRMIDLRRSLNRYAGASVGLHASPKILRMLIAHIDKLIGKPERLAFLTWAFGRQITSSRELSPDEAFGLLMWARPEKMDTGVWAYEPTMPGDIHTWQVEIRGQLELIPREGGLIVECPICHCFGEVPEHHPGCSFDEHAKIREAN